MKKLLSILVFMSVALFVSHGIAADDEELPPLGGTPPAEEGQAAETQEQPTVPPEEQEPRAEAGEQPEGAVEPVEPRVQVEDTGLDEFIWEDQPPAGRMLPPGIAPGKEGEAGPGPRKITIDSVVVINYRFNTGIDSYNVKYHINLGGTVNADVGMIKGNAKIATDISGYLAKTPLFECLLKVSIADIPYEMMFKKVDDKEADINVSFKGQILEDWESLCTFLDASAAKFNTRGSPEKWIAIALEKARPPLTKLTVSLDPEKATTLKFIIAKNTVEDEGLGKAEIEGTGVVTVEPERVLPEEATGAEIPNSERFEAARKLLQKK